MRSPNATPTPITPPRVSLIDPRTGLIDRAWYLFFLSLLNAATAVVDDGVGPDVASMLASYDAALRALADDVNTQPPAIDYSSDIESIRNNQFLQPSPETGELQAQINSLRQQFELLPQLQQGTLSQVNIDWVPYLGFDTAPPWIGSNAGQFWYDSSTGSFNAKMGNNNITQQIGEEIFIYGKASSTITDSPLQIVYKTGTVGASGVLQFAPATTGITDADQILGVATESIATNGFGRITTFGIVHGITTNGTAFGEVWADNDDIWYNPTTGNPTKVKPSAPNLKVQIGTVINAGGGGSGSFFVKIGPSSTLGGTDSNVQFTSLATNDLIQYNGTIWTNVTPASVINAAGGAPVVKTANFSVASTENWLINNKSGSSCTVTLPTPSANIGRVLHFQNYQTQTLVSASSNVVPLAGGAAGTSILLASSGDSATLVSDGSNWLMTQYVPNNILLLE